MFVGSGIFAAGGDCSKRARAIVCLPTTQASEREKMGDYIAQPIRKESFYHIATLCNTSAPSGLRGVFGLHILFARSYVIICVRVLSARLKAGNTIPLFESIYNVFATLPLCFPPSSSPFHRLSPAPTSRTQRRLQLCLRTWYAHYPPVLQTNSRGLGDCRYNTKNTLKPLQLLFTYQYR